MHSIFPQEKPSQVPFSSQKAFITDDNIQSTFSEGEGESQTLQYSSAKCHLSILIQHWTIPLSTLRCQTADVVDIC